jgi:DNA-binding transcriptional ArsR family regulator
MLQSMTARTAPAPTPRRDAKAIAPVSVGGALPFRLPERPSERQLQAKYFRAFGDPTRLHILDLLRGGELSLSELVARVGTSQPRVSAHLACLRWCGFVTTRREQRTIYYRLADERVAEMLDLARALLSDSAAHVAACRTIDGD